MMVLKLRIIAIVSFLFLGVFSSFSIAAAYQNVRCKICNGTGKCSNCRGTGKVNCSACLGGGKVLGTCTDDNGHVTVCMVACTGCNGTGKIDDGMCNGSGTCGVCNGAGNFSK